MWMLLALVHIDNFHDYNATWLAAAEIDLEQDSLASRYIQALYFAVTIMATVSSVIKPLH
jgi:hypothetical protein